MCCIFIFKFRIRICPSRILGVAWKMRAPGSDESQGEACAWTAPQHGSLSLLLFGTPQRQKQLLCACSLRPSLRLPALAAACAGLRHCSELLSEANSCAHSCMPQRVWVSGSLGGADSGADSGSGPAGLSSWGPACSPPSSPSVPSG